MTNKKIINYNCIKIMIILDQFKKVKSEFNGVKRLLFFYLISEYPNILKAIILKLHQKEIYVKDYQASNIETEIFEEKRFYDLSHMKTMLLNLLSRELITIKDSKEGTIIKMTEKGNQLIENIDEILFSDLINRASYIKKYLGNLSNNKVVDLFNEFMPRSIYVE